METEDRKRLETLERGFDVLVSESRMTKDSFSDFVRSHGVEHSKIELEMKERDRMLQQVCKEQAEDRVELRYIRKGQEEIKTGQKDIIIAIQKTKYPPAAKLAFAGVVLMTLGDILIKVWK
jgi:hypothetical protein